MAHLIANAGLANVSTEPPDPLLCPLCGAANLCAVEQGAPIESCWCARVSISKQVLDTVAPALRDKACICPQCAAKTTDNAVVSEWSDQ